MLHFKPIRASNTLLFPCKHIINQYAAKSTFSDWNSIDRLQNSNSKSSKSRKLALSKEDSDMEYVYGLSSVLSALRSQRRSVIDSLYLQGAATGPVTTKKKDDSLLTDIVRLALEAKVKTVDMDKQSLNVLTNNKPHQGVALLASVIKPQMITALTEVTDNGYTALPKGEKVVEAQTFNFNENSPNRRPFWIALDEVQDPQNLGSILRTAYFFGVDGVLLCTKNSAPLSPAVSKVSSGALELMNVFSTTKIVEFLTKSRDNGWEVIGAAGDVEPSITPAQAASTESKFPVILVLGNEAKGLRKNVRNACSKFIRIPSAMHPDSQTFGGSVDSLNVGVAAGVLINSFMMRNQ